MTTFRVTNKTSIADLTKALKDPNVKVLPSLKAGEFDNASFMIEDVTRMLKEQEAVAHVLLKEEPIMNESIVIQAATPAVTPIMKEESPMNANTNVNGINMNEFFVEFMNAQKSLGNVAPAQVDESLESIKVVADAVADMRNKDVNKVIDNAIANGDTATVGKIFKSFVESIANTAKDPEMKAKANIVADNFKTKGLALLEWTKEKGGVAFNFILNAVKFVWENAKQLVVATLYFGGDVLTILWTHAISITKEIGASAVNRYGFIVPEKKGVATV